MSNLLDSLGTEFANASIAGKIVLIDEAIGRVLVSQSSEAGPSRNTRASLEALQNLRKYFQDLNDESGNGGSEILAGYHC